MDGVEAFVDRENRRGPLVDGGDPLMDGGDPLMERKSKEEEEKSKVRGLPEQVHLAVCLDMCVVYAVTL